MRETAADALHRQWGGGRTGSKPARRCFMVPLRPPQGGRVRPGLHEAACQTGILAMPMLQDQVVAGGGCIAWRQASARTGRACTGRARTGCLRAGAAQESAMSAASCYWREEPAASQSPKKTAPVRCWRQGCASCCIRAKTMTGRNACTAAGRTWARGLNNLHVGQTRLHPP